MPAFLMMTCRRGTREADPHSGRVPPKVGGALCATAPYRHATQLPYRRTYRLTPHAPDRWWTCRVGSRNRLIPDATYRRRPTANPSNAPQNEFTDTGDKASGLKLGGEETDLGRSEGHGYQW